MIGRDEEIRRTIQVLSRRTKNNPVLIGEPGVGKTAIVEGLAQRIVAGDVPEGLKGKRVWALDIGACSPARSTGRVRGAAQGRPREIQSSQGEIVLFIDELHTIVGAGAAEGAVSAGNLLKPMLARGELRAVGATTLDGTELAAGEHRLEQVAGGDGALGRTGTHDRVELVDEQDDLRPPAAVISASTALSRSSNSPRYLAPAISAPTVERPDALALQSLRHVARDDAPGARPSAIAVLPTPGSPINTGLFFVRRESTWIVRRYLLVAADHRVELPRLGGGRQVATELGQRLVGSLGILRRDTLPAAHLLERAEERLAGNELEREDPRCSTETNSSSSLRASSNASSSRLLRNDPARPGAASAPLRPPAVPAGAPRPRRARVPSGRPPPAATGCAGAPARAAQR